MATRRQLCRRAAALIETGETVHSCNALVEAFEELVGDPHTTHNQDRILDMLDEYRDTFVSRPYRGYSNWLIDYIILDACPLIIVHHQYRGDLKDIRYRMLMAYGRGERVEIQRVRRDLQNLRRKYQRLWAQQ